MQDEKERDEMECVLSVLEETSYAFGLFSFPLYEKDTICERYQNVIKLSQMASLPENKLFMNTTRKNILLQLHIAEAQALLYQLRTDKDLFRNERIAALHSLNGALPLDMVVINFWKN